MSAKPYDSEQLRTIALGVRGGGWYVLTNPEHARDVIRRLLATLDERSAKCGLCAERHLVDPTEGLGDEEPKK